MCRPKQFLSRQNVRCASGKTFFVTVSIFTRRDFHQTRQIVYKHMSALACIDSSLGLHAWIQRYRISLVFLPRENNYGGRGLCVRHANTDTFWLLWRCLNLWFHLAQFCSPQTQCNVSRARWCCGEWPVASLATTASQKSLCVYVNGWNDCRIDCIGWRDGYRQELRMYDTMHPVNMYGLLYKHQ